MQSYPHLRRWLAATGTAVVLGAVLVLAVLFGRSPAPQEVQAKDDVSEKVRVWPMFGGHLDRNMVNTVETNMPTDWSVEKGKEKNIKWVANLGSRSYSGPVVSGGKVFVGTNRAAPRTPPIRGDKGVVRCYGEADGKLLWQAVHDKLAAGLVNDWPDQGVCSTPVVEGKRIYYVSNRCEVICASTEGLRDGKNEGVTDEKYKDAKEKTDADIIWRLDMMKELGVFPHNLATSSPLVVGDLMYLVTSNGVDEGHINIPAPQAPSFLAVNKKNGKVVWKTNAPSAKVLQRGEKEDKESFFKKLQDRGQSLVHGQWSNPCFAVVKGKPQVLFPGGDGRVRAYEPNPSKKEWKLLWEFDCNPKESIWKLQGKGTRNNIIATPVVHENKLYVGVGQDPEHKYGVGHFWCVDITKSGDLSPELVVSYDGKKTKKNPLGVKTKKNPNSGVIWHYGGPAPADSDRDFAFGRTISTAAVHDGLCYIAELEGYLHCLDAKTGKKYWEHNLNAEVWGSPYWVDNKVYIGNDDGQMHIFAHGKKKDLLKVIEMGARIRSTAVAVNGVLFIMTEPRLYAIKK
jgi:outer membrane protein assembly factor BamB